MHRNIYNHKEIIIVGNAAPKEDYSRLVDSHDIIVRFNHCQYLSTGMIGRRTTHLVVQNMDEKYRKGIHPIIEWDKLVILAENKNRDYTEVILKANKWKAENYQTIYTDYLGIKEKLNANGGSSGFIMIEWLLKEKQSVSPPIKIICFEWKGWKGHAWDEERRHCFNYQKEGKLEIL